MLTRAEAQSVVEATLRGRQPARRMTPTERLQFCQRMYAGLSFSSKGDPVADIQQWVEQWEAV